MPEITEAMAYAALGLTAPETAGAEGATAQEPADPVQSQNNPTEPAEGAREQEIAEPAQSGAQPEDTDPQQDPESAGESGSQPQSEEERRANAARRRQQEQQAAIDAAVAAARQEEQQKAADALKNLFTRAGMRNTFTGEPITTQAEFDAWQTQFRNEQLKSQLAKGELTVESLNQLVDNHPVVQQARDALAGNQPAAAPSGAPAQPSPQQVAAQQAADNARIEAEIAEIRKLDPSVQSIGDILKSPTGKEFYAKVQQGYSFLDAFRSVNFERLTQAKAQAAQQQAVINNRGKDHMTGANNSRGNGALSVPADQMAMFRTLNPKATDAQIQAFYNKYVKGR